MALQPVWKMVPDLMKNSKYQREGQGPECTVERDGKKYEIRMVHSTDEKTVQEIQELMEETFVKEEVDPIEVLKAGIDGKLLDGSEDVARYRLYVARDEAGKIQSVYTGGMVGMADAAFPGEAMFMGAYGIVSTERQGKSGLGLAAQKRKIPSSQQARERRLRVEFQRAIQLAKRANAKIVIARLDRFSRRVSFIANILEQGIGLVCAEMPNATDFQLHIFAALAQEERRLISERTKAALAEAKRRGKILSTNGKNLAAKNRAAAD
jgi:Resolvase, N terminal domain